MTIAVLPDTAALAARLRLGVTRLARRLRQEAEPGITPSMLATLSSVERHGPLTMSELCAVEQVQPPSMTRIVAALAEAELVTRTTDEDDRRVVRVEVSSSGRRLLERARRRKEAYLAKALRGLEPGEIETLEAAAAILERLTERRP
ncbi:MAG TPA: MarR family transcriptional regulator [Actinomycetota bacterium]